MSPKNVTDSLQATFQRRPDRKHVYQQCMMMVMLVSMMAGMGEGYCEFMYTKRLFQWKVETYSYFNLIKARNSIIASLIWIFQLANISEFSCECWYIYFNANISLLQSQWQHHHIAVLLFSHIDQNCESLCKIRGSIFCFNSLWSIHGGVLCSHQSSNYQMCVSWRAWQGYMFFCLVKHVK